MTSKVLSKILEDFPWLWAVKQRWRAANADVHVITASEDEFLATLFNAWKKVHDGTVRIWAHTTRPGSTKEQDIERVMRIRPEAAAEAYPIHAILNSLDAPGSKVDFLAFALEAQRDDHVVSVIHIYRPPRHRGDFREYLLAWKPATR